MIRLLATVAVFAAMAGTAHADCTSPAGKAGALAYAGNFGVMAFCNGTQWVSMAGGIDVTINGSGSGALSGLSDVALTTPAPGDFLNFNGTDWVNVNPFGTVTDTKWCVASSGRIECNTDAPLTSLSSIDDLADVDTSGAAPNSILAWNGSTWVVSATTIAETDPQVGTLTNSQWCTTDGNVINCATAAPVLTEADPKVGTLTNGQWCTTDGSVINCSTAAPLTASAVLNDLADVDTAGVAPGKILAFDGTNWVISDSTVAVSAGGNPTNVQFNNSGNFGGSDDFTWANSVLTVNGVVTATQVYASQVSASQGHIGALTGATGSLGGLTVSGDASISRVSATDISGTVLEMIGTTFTSLLGGSGNAIASATSSVSTSSDNTIKFATNGSQRMVIDATGQLGIGTTAPNALVDVAGLISTSSLTVNGVAITGGTSSQWTTTGSDIYYNTGKVGIGTTGPANPLHVESSSTGYLGLFKNTDAASYAGMQLNNSAGTGLTLLTYGPSYAAGSVMSMGASSAVVASGASAPFGLAANDGQPLLLGQVSNERMRITSAGNVGIGTASPQQALDVSGILRSGDASSCTGATALAVRYGTLSEGATATFGSGRSECGPVLGRNVHPSSVSVGAFTSANPYNTSRNALVMGDELRYYTGAAQTVAIGGAVTMTERFRIDASGNVGIGTTGPSAKLHAYSASQYQIMASGYAEGVASTGNGEIRLGENDIYQARFYYNAQNAADVMIDNTWNSANGDIRFRTRTSGTPVTGLVIAGDGVITFGAYGAGTLQTNASGVITASSDERLKDIKRPFTRGLHDLQNVTPLTYRWNETSGMDDGHEYSGFSAQNVQSSIPEAVSRDAKGYLTLSDRPLLATTINAVKELKAANDNLRNEHAAQLKALRAEMEALKKAIQH